jgi:hypothetical protein
MLGNGRGRRAGAQRQLVHAFEGNKAKTNTMLPVIEAFMAAPRLPDVTVVADAGMMSAANQKQIEAAGLSFVPRREDPAHADLHTEFSHLGARRPDGRPDQRRPGHRTHDGPRPRP